MQYAAGGMVAGGGLFPLVLVLVGADRNFAGGVLMLPVGALWRHETRKLSFTLVVDDFGVKYQDEKDVEHLFEDSVETIVRRHYRLGRKTVRRGHVNTRARTKAASRGAPETQKPRLLVAS